MLICSLKRGHYFPLVLLYARRAEPQPLGLACHGGGGEGGEDARGCQLECGPGQCTGSHPPTHSDQGKMS